MSDDLRVDCDRVRAWLDDDSDLRIPETGWGVDLYSSLRALLAATPAPEVADDEREALERAVDRIALSTTSKAAVAWGMPLLDILSTEGHVDDCDALASENLTACDCWWARVRRAAEALSEIATAADDALASLGAGDDFVVTVERILARRAPVAGARPDGEPATQPADQLQVAREDATERPDGDALATVRALADEWDAYALSRTGKRNPPSGDLDAAADAARRTCAGQIRAALAAADATPESGAHA